MSIPIPPWWLRILNGGNAQNYAVAGVAFVVGYYLGKGDRSHWKDVARSADSHWHKEHGWNNDSHHNDNHRGRHTERERDREHERDRHYKHGDSYER